MNVEEAKTAFCREKRLRLVRWLTGLGTNPADAEDLAQEALFETIRRWESLDDPARYLFCVAWNKLIRLLKAQGRHEAAVRVLERSPGQLHARDVYRRLETEQARLHMLVLPPEQRAAFVSCYDGLSGKEAAEALGKPETTVRSSLRAAREKVRPFWEEPDTDLNRLVLEQAYAELRDGNTSLPGVRPLIRESWKRCKERGIDPGCGTLVALLDPDMLEARRAAYPFPGLDGTGYAGLVHLASTHQLLLVVTDADGYVLHTYGDVDVVRRAVEGEFRTAALWTERTIGTSGISIALENRHPIYVRPLEHYAESQRRRFACAAAPVLDRDGRVLMVLNLTSLWRAADPRMLRYVAAAASRLESWLRQDAPRVPASARDQVPGQASQPGGTESSRPLGAQMPYM